MGKRSRQARRAQRKRPSAGMAPAAAERADVLLDAPSFADLPASPAQLAAFEGACASHAGDARPELGCVIRLDRGFPLVLTATRCVRAEHAVSFAKQGVERRDAVFPAVGDRVVLSCPEGHEMAVVESVLPRSTSLERWRGSNRGERQVLAANVDVVLIAAQLSDRGVSLDRVARSLVIALDCGARPAVVLTKADRVSSSFLGEEVERVRGIVGAGCPVVATASLAGEGLEPVRRLVPQGMSAVILGESGAGKSTLLNALLGHEAMRTGAVRERDDMGRHTTVARVMLKIPGAGAIVDAPGLRSLPLVGHEQGLARAFPEIVSASRGCRFGDCSHEGEPGCAVRALVDAGEIPSERLDVFLSLAREMRVSAQELDPDVRGR